MTAPRTLPRTVPVRLGQDRRPVSPGPRIATYGYFGMGNIGNEGSLASVLESLRRTFPDARLSCFGAGAEAVHRDHGVPATQLMTYRARPGRRGPGTLALKAASRIWDVPRTFRMMGDVDLLVVPGTGILESKLVASPWGLPYWLFLATLSCRLRGRQVALLSVGGEYAPDPVTRWLYRWTVRLATYASYRDEESREAVRAMGVKTSGPVYPDVVFALPTPPVPAVRPGHVVIGIMAYDGDPAAEERGAPVRRTYVANITELVVRLLAGGRTVTLVVGDEGDFGLASDIAELVRAAEPALAADGLTVSPAVTLDQIMEEMGAAEVVVATRFHNVVCALMLRKPLVSLGYAEKNEHLLEEFGLGQLTQPIDAFDVERVLDQMAQAQALQPSVDAQMVQTLGRLKEELDAQMRRLEADVMPRLGRRGPPGARGWARLPGRGAAGRSPRRAR